MDYLDWILLAIAVLLIIIIVLQNPKEDASKAFSGEKSELFANQKERGVEKVISQITTCLSVLFFAMSLFIFIARHTFL